MKVLSINLRNFRICCCHVPCRDCNYIKCLKWSFESGPPLKVGGNCNPPSYLCPALYIGLFGQPFFNQERVCN